jgi:hypothetical protein
VSNAVVVCTATYCWQQRLRGLKSIKKVILQYSLKVNTNVLNALKKLKTLPKIRYTIPNHFSHLQLKLVSVNIATLYSRCKPPGRRRPTIFPDFDFFSLGFPNPPALVWPSDGFLFAGNRSPNFATDRKRFQSSHLPWLIGENPPMPPNQPADNCSSLLQHLTGFILLVPKKRDNYLKKSKIAGVKPFSRESWEDQWPEHEEKIWQVGKNMDRYFGEHETVDR